jgi:hypothetical protein
VNHLWLGYELDNQSSISVDRDGLVLFATGPDRLSASPSFVFNRQRVAVCFPTGIIFFLSSRHTDSGLHPVRHQMNTGLGFDSRQGQNFYFCHRVQANSWHSQPRIQWETGWGSIPSRNGEFCFRQLVQKGFKTHPSYSISTEVSFSGDKFEGSNANHQPHLNPKLRISDYIYLHGIVFV